MELIEKWVPFLFVLMILTACKNKEDQKEPMKNSIVAKYYEEPYRPQFHFTPEQMWMNDPNGMVYHKGVYHLFYQYYPDSTVWGPMHWGHAISKDLVHFEHKPIALYPDELGYIFSGSAVLDKSNTSGFGTKENPPLVAIYTYHDMEGEKAGRNDYQTQGIAYSLDNGESWAKFEGNPVIGNGGIKDFRDPKVMWHEASKRWIMTLVAGDHAQFYSSKDLKEWQLTGEFGKDKGAHGGVWECPDLFKLKIEGSAEEKWILLISVNPGAPNGGSGTQYFIGDFDGKRFATAQDDIRWVDWGTDNYAGVTYSNAPNDETIFIGWMSNWAYAQDTPTETWRSAMTVPRKLSLRKVGERHELINYPIEYLQAIIENGDQKKIEVPTNETETIAFNTFSQSEIRFKTASRDFDLVFKNSLGENFSLEMDSEKGVFTLDRAQSGKIDFQEDFGGSVQKMPISNLPNGEVEVRILIDASSVEVFVNKGQYVMTAQLFPNEDYNELDVANPSNTSLEFADFRVSSVKRIW